MNKAVAKAVLIFLFFAFLIENSSAKHKPTLLPIRFIENEPVAEVMINNHKTSLILDLGTSGHKLALTKEVLLKSSAKYLGVIPNCEFANYKGQKFSCKKFLVKNFKIGQLRFKNIYAIEFPGINFFSDSSRYPSELNNGTIGIELLKDFNLLLNFSEKYIYILKKNEATPFDIETWHSIQFFYKNNGCIHTQARINNNDVTILWDTGNTNSTIQPKFANILQSEVACSFSANEKCLKVSNIHSKTYQYGEFELLLKESKEGSDISLGNDFFMKHIIYIDFANKKILINK